MYNYSKTKYFPFYPQTFSYNEKNTFTSPVASKHFNRKRYAYKSPSHESFKSKFKYKKSENSNRTSGNLTLNSILGRNVVNLSKNVYKFVNGKTTKSKKNVYRNYKEAFSKNNQFCKNNSSLQKYKHFAPSRTFSVSNRLVNRSRKYISLRANKQEHCSFFNKFGRCHKGVDCSRIHDPERITICTRFLRGKCQISNCLFSHKVSPERMPVCSFFLRGLCARSDKCLYRHVKVSVQADVCKDFLSGYCAAGVDCKKKHDDTCGEYSEKGFCALAKKCPLRHINKSNKTTSKFNNNTNNNSINNKGNNKYSYSSKNSNMNQKLIGVGSNNKDNKNKKIVNKISKNKNESSSGADKGERREKNEYNERRLQHQSSFISLDSSFLSSSSSSIMSPRPDVAWSILPRLD